MYTHIHRETHVYTQIHTYTETHTFLYTQATYIYTDTHTHFSEALRVRCPHRALSPECVLPKKRPLPVVTAVQPSLRPLILESTGLCPLLSPGQSHPCSSFSCRTGSSLEAAVAFSSHAADALEHCSSVWAVFLWLESAGAAQLDHTQATRDPPGITWGTTRPPRRCKC